MSAFLNDVPKAEPSQLHPMISLSSAHLWRAATRRPRECVLAEPVKWSGCRPPVVDSVDDVRWLLARQHASLGPSTRFVEAQGLRAPLLREYLCSMYSIVCNIQLILLIYTKYSHIRPYMLRITSTTQ